MRRGEETNHGQKRFNSLLVVSGKVVRLVALRAARSFRIWWTII